MSYTSVCLLKNSSLPAPSDIWRTFSHRISHHRVENKSVTFCRQKWREHTPEGGKRETGQENSILYKGDHTSPLLFHALPAEIGINGAVFTETGSARSVAEQIVGPKKPFVAGNEKAATCGGPSKRHLSANQGGILR